MCGFKEGAGALLEALGGGRRDGVAVKEDEAVGKVGVCTGVTMFQGACWRNRLTCHNLLRWFDVVQYFAAGRRRIRNFHGSCGAVDKGIGV